MIELKPCPFCGEKPIKFEHSMEILSFSTKHFLEVHCSCGMTFTKKWGDIPLFRLNEPPVRSFGYESAIEKWNTRTQQKEGNINEEKM